MSSSCVCYNIRDYILITYNRNNTYIQGLYHLRFANNSERALEEFAKLPNDWRALMRIYEIKQDFYYLVEAYLCYQQEGHILCWDCSRPVICPDIKSMLSNVSQEILLKYANMFKGKYQIHFIMKFLDIMGVNIAFVTDEQIKSITHEIDNLKKLIETHLNCRPGGPEAIKAAEDFKNLSSV